MYNILATSNIPEVHNSIDFNTLISVIVPGVISIVGYIITTISVNSSFKNELAKQKSNIHIDKMSTMPYEILRLMDKIQHNEYNEKKSQESISVLMNTIYSYGSKSAINLISSMQKENYQNLGTPDNAIGLRIMAFYALLATQIKYDVTGITVSPELWYQMKLTDYGSNKEQIMIENNKIVIEFNLNKDFIIR